jgi:hypothetical protein
MRTFFFLGIVLLCGALASPADDANREAFRRKGTDLLHGQLARKRCASLLDSLGLAAATRPGPVRALAEGADARADPRKRKRLLRATACAALYSSHASTGPIDTHGTHDMRSGLETLVDGDLWASLPRDTDIAALAGSALELGNVFTSERLPRLALAYLSLAASIRTDSAIPQSNAGLVMYDHGEIEASIALVACRTRYALPPFFFFFFFLFIFFSSFFFFSFPHKSITPPFPS